MVLTQTSSSIIYVCHNNCTVIKNTQVKTPDNTRFDTETNEHKNKIHLNSKTTYYFVIIQGWYKIKHQPIFPSHNMSN